MPKTVCMSRVVTEIEFLNRSRDLEASLTQGKFAEFCKKKIAESSSTTDKTIWDFVKVYKDIHVYTGITLWTEFSREFVCACFQGYRKLSPDAVSRHNGMNSHLCWSSGSALCWLLAFKVEYKQPVSSHPSGILFPHAL